MIAPEKHKQALKAIQNIMIHARFLAYMRDDYAKISEILDYGEILPTLFFSEEDDTEKFSDYLQELSKTQVRCIHIYKDFIKEP